MSPERAAYEADPWAPQDIAWEELFSDDKEKYRAIAHAVIKASPELAEARATIDGLRALVTEILAHPGAQQILPPDVAGFVERAGIKPAQAGAR